MNGLFQNQSEVDNYATQVENGTAPGDVKFRDLNNDGVINAEDRTYIGNPFPEWTFSMNNNFNYKNIDLQIFLQGVGRQRYLQCQPYMARGNVGATKPNCQSKRPLDWRGH